jgi:hypothetical protein
VLEELRQAEVARNRKRFQAEDHDQLDKFSKALIRKVEGLMAANLREASRQHDDLSLAQAVVRATQRGDEDEGVQETLKRLKQEGSH